MKMMFVVIVCTTSNNFIKTYLQYLKSLLANVEIFIHISLPAELPSGNPSLCMLHQLSPCISATESLCGKVKTKMIMMML